MADGESGLRWIVEGGPEYELEDIEKSEPETTVTLHLNSESLRTTNPETLKTAVRKYADFLSFPIFVNNEGPINTMQAPWHRSYSGDRERQDAYQTWVRGRFPGIPLEIMPVDMETPHPVKGVLYISDRHVPDVNMAGMLDIYQAMTLTSLSNSANTGSSAISQ